MIVLEIDTTDHRLGFDLFSPAKLLEPGTAVDIPGGAHLTIKEMYVRKAFGAHETLTLLLHFGRDISVGVIGSWLYDKLKHRAITVRIDRVEVQIEEGEIRRVLAEHIERDGAP
jgi:hypothetical protein